MNRLIRAPSWRLVQVVPQIDVQFLPCTNVPRTRIWPRYTGSSPRQTIALPCKLSVCVLRLAERDRERVVVDVARFAHDAVQQFCGLAWCRHELDELTVDNLELPCRSVVAQKSSTSSVERLGLHVFVEVGRRDGSNPVVAGLQCLAWAGTCGCAS